MRKLVLKMSVSADGFVGGPNGEIDWLLCTMDPSAAKWVINTLWQAGMHIMGSRTFQDMAAYWPASPDRLAAPMNEIPKAVFSKKGFIDRTTSAGSTQAIKNATNMDKEKGITPTAVSKHASTWTNAAVYKDLISGVAQLKQQEGKFILAHGGAGFAQQLVKHNLVDEYRLVVHPVILGKGLPLFALAPTQIDLKLESSTAFAGGIIANIYSRT